MCTLYQDTYNPKTDYIDKSDPSHWRMYADYYKLPSDPVKVQDEYTEDKPKGLLDITSATNVVKINGGWKTLTASIYDDDGLPVETSESFVWSFSFGDDSDITDLISTAESTAVNKIKIKFMGDESYVGRKLMATCTAAGLTGKQSFDIIIM